MHQQKTRDSVNIKVKEGWVSDISLNPINGIVPAQNMMVDYGNLSFRCQVCLSWKHLVKDHKVASRQAHKGAIK